MSTDVVDAKRMAGEGLDPGAIPVLDHGFVRLDGCMADDLSVVNAARVSFAQHSTEVGERDQGLIRFLMRERHGTPFEHNAFRFHVKLPIFVMREWARHRMGSFNEWSARYSQLEPEFYVPAEADVRTQVGKPGSYTFDPVDPELAEHTQRTQRAVYEQAYAAYAELLERGVAKEVARNVLPVAIYTQFYWTVNARSLMNFLSLRNAVTAQREIRRYAAAVEQLFAERMPITHSAFVANERRAP
jgi:thymidylate synthase (FAD)